MKRPENRPLYLFECGCLLPFPKKNQQPWEKQNYKYVCPVHRRRVKNKIYKCIKCGRAITTSFSVNVKLYCKDCMQLEKKRYSKKAYANREKARRLNATIIKELNTTVSTARKSDCKHYLTRCMQFGGAILSDPKACTFCRHYEKMTPTDTMDDYHKYKSCADHGTRRGVCL